MGGDFATAKDFVRAKQPKGEKQLVACLAWWLEHRMETPTFKSADIQRVNRDEAKGHTFNVPRAVNDAARPRCAYLSSVGSGGQKQLSAFGEDIVEALPDHEAVKELEAKRKSSRRRAANRTKKKAKKK